MVSQNRAWGNNRARGNEATTADGRCLREQGRPVAGQRSFNRVVRVQMRAGANVYIVPDGQAALAVEHGKRADPAVPADFHVAEDQAPVIDRSSVTETVVARQLPAIVQEI